jgi:hypothetical protein
VIVHIRVNPRALSSVAVEVRIQLKMKVSSNFILDLQRSVNLKKLHPLALRFTS